MKRLIFILSICDNGWDWTWARAVEENKENAIIAGNKILNIPEKKLNEVVLWKTS